MKISTFISILKQKLILILFFLVLIPQVQAQYFGRNKPSYRRFDFRVFETPHFEIFHYFENDSVVQAIGNTLEKWYARHKVFFLDSFTTRSPVIIYGNHPEFQQTRAVGGTISIGTQGLAEALMNRIVMPILETNAQTDHVLGHEVAHVFHFNIMFGADTLGMNSMRNIPLWLVEGMAEYFSVGSIDSHTAMMMRDAIHKDEFPTLEDMTRNMRYNPYRFGHSFFAFFGRTWGDSLITPFFRESAKFGYERALERIVGLSSATVSNLWKAAMTTHYEPLMADSSRHVSVGRKLVSEENAGEMNLSPSLSPDGRFITFFSERDLVTLDLFLADAKTGRIIRRLNSTIRNQDIDGFNFFESVGSWSPDGRQFAYVVVAQGQNKLMIVDVNRPRRTRQITIPGILSFNNPAWSPNGQYFAFNAIVDGRTNLFLYNIENESVTNLTNDRYSYIHSNWSPDGRYLAFATDRPQNAQMGNAKNFRFNLGILDMKDPTRGIRVLNVFPEANNVNPLWNADGTGLYFLSNRDGYRNLYFVDVNNESEVYQLTDFYTGISGITQLSPAISISRQTGEMVYSHFQNGQYTIFRAQADDFQRRRVDPMFVDFTAATLPPFDRPSLPLIDPKLAYEPETPVFPVDSFAERPFTSRFQLAHIGSTGVGMATNRFGTGLAGGVSMLFSDITGDHQMFGAFAVNGEIYDFGGQFGYLNQRGRIRWGGMVSHIPFPFAFMRFGIDTLSTSDGPIVVDNLQILQYRIFENQITGFAFFPISTTRRLETTASLSWYYYRIDAWNNYYHMGFPIGQERERLPSPPGFNLQRVSLSYVGDNSYFGMASPIRGQRFRFGVEQIFGTVSMTNLTADFRQYIHVKPFTFAVRATHFGRYGSGADDQTIFNPLYLGFPGFVRGLDYNSLYRLQNSELGVTDDIFDFLLGSKVLLGGAEIRIPFTGPERLALITSGFLFTELNLFFDVGVAWRGDHRLTLNPDYARAPGKRYPFFSIGPSLRINVFGALIVEPFFAFPFQTGGPSRGVWGLNFLPGW
ncbi:MAG TPA: hypothetical protein VLH37_08715 [Bacteroidales bacterium]|nr:hypothetical protein [Bacteroidales bacterium]